jgi:hypothetical protein
MKTEWNNSITGLKQEREHSSILEALDIKRIFSVQKLNDGTFDFVEQCDQCFGLALTKDQLLGLIEELKELANT